MKHISLAEARADIDGFLNEVERGVDLRITLDGSPKLAEPHFDAEKREQAIKALQELREMRKTAPRVTIEEILAWRHEGHKY